MSRSRRGIAAAGSVVVGALVAVMINLLTGQWNWALAVGLVGTVLLWAGIEVWRATRGGAGPSGSTSVVQRARTVGGQLLGVRQPGTEAGGERSLSIEQTVDEIREGGNVTGYDGTAQPRRDDPRP
jgi:hypothetical protein